MSTPALDDEYEYFTSAPQWADFTEMSTDNQCPTSFFDHSHEELEPLNDVPNKKEILGRLRNRKIMPSPLVIKPPSSKLTIPDETSFIHDLDKINMTPIKVLSPKSGRKEVTVLQELNINEVLSEAMDGMAIASSISRKTPKKNLNATVCPSSVDNSKAPGQRKIRPSRSVDHQTSTRLTPAAKAAITPRVMPTEAKSAVKLVKIQESHVETHDVSQHKVTIVDDASKENSANTVTYPKTPLRSSLRIANAMHMKTPNKTPNVANNSRRSQVPTIKIAASTPGVSECEISTKQTIDNKLTQEKNEIVNIEKDIKQITATPRKASMPERINIDDHDEEEDDEADDAEDTFRGFQVDIDDPFQEDFPVHKTQHPKKPTIRQKQPSLLTNPARRHSILDNRRRRSNRYVSLAEAVSSYQRSTPTRFRSRVEAVPAAKPKPAQRTRTIPVSPVFQSKIRAQASKVSQPQKVEKQNKPKPIPKPAPTHQPTRTIPISPALQCKQRIRRNHVLSQAEREELELQDMRKHQIHARPVPRKVLAGPSTLEHVPVKPVTVPKPFHLTQVKKPSQKAAPAPSTTAIPTQVKAVKAKKTVTTFKNTGDGTMIDDEIRHYGIPASIKGAPSSKPNEPKKLTRPQPFSMEDRNREFLRKKEERIKKLQEQEKEKLKAEFHARPMPAAVKKSVAQKNIEEKPAKSSTHVKIAPFSFEDRYKNSAAKIVELRKKQEEEAKKARIFHANPAPTFKPVTVRATSRENLRMEKTKSNDNLVAPLKTRGLSADNLRQTVRERHQSAPGPMGPRGLSAGNLKSSERTKASSATASKESVNDNSENREPNVATRTVSAPAMPALKPKLKVLPVELHSDKRAKLRREYDEKMKQKLEQDEERLRREQQAKLAREQQEIAELRKKAEPKARPMPVYKPLVVTKSNKPLTEAESPAWSRRR